MVKCSRTNCDNDADLTNDFKIIGIDLCAKCLKEIQEIKRLKKVNRHKRK